MLGPEALSKNILEEQVENGWNGLVKDAVAVSDSVRVHGLLDGAVTKKAFKKSVKTVLKQRHDEEVKQEINKYKKMTILRNEKEKDNKYIKEENIPSARVLYKYRCDMYDSKMNFKNNIEY